jgi:hypothetical protein
MVIQISQHFKLNFYRSLRPIYFKRLKLTLFFPHVLLQIFLHLGVNFIDVKRAHFSYKRLFSSYILALNELSYKKFVGLTLMKLTEGMTSTRQASPVTHFSLFKTKREITSIGLMAKENLDKHWQVD